MTSPTVVPISHADLRGVGDRYVDPLGITWKLID
jgi:hypothetical protein